MQELGYITESTRPNFEVKLKGAYELIQNQSGQVTIANLRTFLEAVHGIHRVSGYESETKSVIFKQSMGYVNEEGEFCVESDST